jgi:hypothetical protein
MPGLMRLFQLLLCFAAVTALFNKLVADDCQNQSLNPVLCQPPGVLPSCTDVSEPNCPSTTGANQFTGPFNFNDPFTDPGYYTGPQQQMACYKECQCYWDYFLQQCEIDLSNVLRSYTMAGYPSYPCP